VELKKLSTVADLFILNTISPQRALRRHKVHKENTLNMIKNIISDP